ncbi:MAG TPA: hypothetical protein VF665_12120 [Longimicrobium sp.]|jgi:hypothetical protein|uniref:hypothetical protein n=1 Tax=Longimicrobium sp. TaxID=2029185 RepID=UPI002ED9D3C5
MFGMIGAVLTLTATLAVTAFGYLQSRKFVRGRLAYVDAVQRGYAPFVAAAGAFALALPVVGILPFIGGGTALLFGAAVGTGVAAGAKDTRLRRLRA